MLPPSPDPQTRENEPEGIGRKRRRIVQACEECRDRKRKCDGGRPVCGACSRRPGQSCVWNDDRNTKGWSKNYVEGLRARIRQLESAMSTSSADTVDQAAPSDANRILDHADQPTYPPESLPTAMPTLPLLGPQSASPPVPAMGGSPDMMRGRAVGEAASEPSLRGPPRGTDNSSNGTDDGEFNAMASDSSETGMDAMGVVRCANGTKGRARRSSGYFGPSSTFSLLDDAYSAINGRPRGKDSQDGGGVPMTRGKHRHGRGGGRGADPGIRSLNLSVPRRAEADELLESYWTWVHSLYPFLHRPSFDKRYRSIWAGKGDSEELDGGGGGVTSYYDDVGDGLFHCLLNLVFAMGAPFNAVIPFEDRDTVSRTFFRRAKVLIDLDTLACGSTAMVQALLLMCQYLQSTDEASSCWNTVGLAVRVAQGVGLHHEPQCCWNGHCESGHSQLEVEMRRRTWMGAMLFDRVLSMTYGRPLMIHPSLTRNRLFLPLAIDDQYLTGPGEPPGQQPAETVSLVECYVAAVRLQDVIGELVMSSNYIGMGKQDRRGMEGSGPGGRCRENTAYRLCVGDLDLQTILDIENLLVEWRESLPEHLCPQSFKDGRAAALGQDQHRVMLLERQANVLEARYLHARLALFRPALSLLCKSVPKPGENPLDTLTARDRMSWAMMTKAADLCVSAAGDLTNAITGNADLGFQRLQAPWYSVFYVHSCAMVLLLGYLCSPTYISCMDETSLMESYNRCLSFFEESRPHLVSAQRCSKVLQLIQQQVFRYRNGPQEGNSFGFLDLPFDMLRGGPAPVQPVPPLGDPRDGQPMFSQTFPLEDVQFDQLYAGRILNDTYEATWLPHLTF
ncbi:Transcription factor [Cordyceps fumosorosea ARSEF 2679]|uniref:Transcription factor n=1 Tax=Cordyceps fumosorosea (strain ARSEF 2679) TaxID=1081104 RepID=A0A167LEU3_CORFA|nr:Transcription factor [Cordyceps fumosorosea ARSEF 2679]OAA53003.1 Transcription factor [Cordyceps fumosorosea ARSEF 2679]